MCGIFCCIYNCGDCQHKLYVEALEEGTLPLVKRRGPDSSNKGKITATHHGTGECLTLNLFGSVLHLRGELTIQPLNACKGNTLLWNGEIFGGIEVPDQANDTAVLLDLLGKYDDIQDILSTLSHIQGPWSIIYYQANKQRLWFGRDYFGRRSLLWHQPTNNVGVFGLSSVAERDCQENDWKLVWEEVPADGIYCIDLSPTEENCGGQIVEKFQFCSSKLTRYPWTSSGYLKQPVIIQFKKELPTSSDLSILDEFYKENNLIPSKNSEKCLNDVSLRTSKLSIGRDTIDTGENDCTKKETHEYNSYSVQPLTMLCKEVSNLDCSSDSVTNDHKESKLNINTDLTYNVDSLQAICSRAVIASDTVSPLREMSSWTDYYHNLPIRFIKILGEAVRKRVVNLPQRQYKTESDASGFKIARVGILFSGGIDSVVLAVLADRFVPSNEAIDLINVAFEQKQLKPNPTNKRKAKPSCTSILGPSFDVPDRITGRAGLIELAAINPARQWNFIEVNVCLQELQKERSEHITHLVSPLNSVLDDSIGCALWFAARGSGLLKCPACISSTVSCVHPQQYTSTAKVLLVGMGADEQLGGYARHRTKFNQEGWLGLANEMEMEVARISHRNLGRDDRCISDHGREARFPFLDEEVVSFLNGLPVWLKADPRQQRGIGEKILLRMSAQRIGLTSSAVLPKRAIQFGSRIAKLEGTNEKGSDTCTRLKQ